jgi:hypothetical protein
LEPKISFLKVAKYDEVACLFLPEVDFEDEYSQTRTNFYTFLVSLKA